MSFILIVWLFVLKLRVPWVQINDNINNNNKPPSPLACPSIRTAVTRAWQSDCLPMYACLPHLVCGVSAYTPACPTASSPVCMRFPHPISSSHRSHIGSSVVRPQAAGAKGPRFGSVIAQLVQILISRAFTHGAVGLQELGWYLVWQSRSFPSRLSRSWARQPGLLSFSSLWIQLWISLWIIRT